MEQNVQMQLLMDVNAILEDYAIEYPNFCWDKFDFELREEGNAVNAYGIVDGVSLFHSKVFVAYFDGEDWITRSVLKLDILNNMLVMAEAYNKNLLGFKDRILEAKAKAEAKANPAIDEALLKKFKGAEEVKVAKAKAAKRRRR